jgi:hypothetical protein
MRIPLFIVTDSECSAPPNTFPQRRWHRISCTHITSHLREKQDVVGEILGHRVVHKKRSNKREPVDALPLPPAHRTDCMGAARCGFGRGHVHAQGLTSELARAIAPRCITVALALPVGAQLGASSLASITAVSVVLTGLLGANFAQTLLDKLGFKDPITRGLATAASSHGLGTVRQLSPPASLLSRAPLELRAGIASRGASDAGWGALTTYRARGETLALCTPRPTSEPACRVERLDRRRRAS